MAKMIQLPVGDIIIPTSTAQDVQEKIGGVENEKSISLTALGLLTNLASYPSSWELNKTELYKRFANEKKTAVMNAWDSLVNANYIIEFKYREGRSYEYVYFYRVKPLSEEEIEKILLDAKEQYGEIMPLKTKKDEKISASENQKPKKSSSKISASDFGKSKMGSSKPEVNKDPLYNSIPLGKEEEEENTPVQSELISFLISKEITLENAIKFENRLIRDGLTGFTHDQCLKAIEWALYQFLEEKCDEPYIYAVGRLKRLLDGKIKKISSNTKKVVSKKPSKRSIRSEMLPSWMNADGEVIQPEEKKVIDLEEEAKRKKFEEEKKKLFDRIRKNKASI